MNAEILAVGTELLMGEIVNTDAQYISGRLAEIGVNVYRHTVVGDNHDRLKTAVAEALERADVLITSGGLGPTPDDLTKEVLAEYAGAELIKNDEALARMTDYFKSSGKQMTQNNVKQAMMPEGSFVMQNNHGTAPGCIIEKNGKILIMLPGPPNELQPMFEEYVVPYLNKKTPDMFYSKVYRLFGIGESAAAEKLDRLMRESENPTVAPYAKTGEVRLRVTARCKDKADGERIISSVEREIYDKVGEYIYSSDGKSLCETVVDLLMKKGMTIATAESCTGGYIAKQITDIPGSSEVFGEGIVTYSNAAKVKYLNVSEDTLAAHGAVSEETAREMAEGLLKNTGADIAAAVTGIAGPGGGTAEKPVGLVYAAVASKKGTYVRKLNIKGSRQKVRDMTVLNVFDMVLKRVKDEI